MRNVFLFVCALGFASGCAEPDCQDVAGTWRATFESDGTDHVSCGQSYADIVPIPNRVGASCNWVWSEGPYDFDLTVQATGFASGTVVDTLSNGETCNRNVTLERISEPEEEEEEEREPVRR